MKMVIVMRLLVMRPSDDASDKTVIGTLNLYNRGVRIILSNAHVLFCSVEHNHRGPALRVGAARRHTVARDITCAPSQV